MHYYAVAVDVHVRCVIISMTSVYTVRSRRKKITYYFLVRVHSASRTDFH